MPILGLGNDLARSVVQKFRNIYSLAFDGTNDHIQLPASDALFTGTNITVSVWFKLADADDTVLFHNQKGAGSSHFAIIANYVEGGAADGYVGLITWNGSSHDWLSYDGNVDTSGNWHHVVATASDGQQKLYLDGSEVDDGSAAFGTNATPDASHIGSFHGASRFAGGNISDVAFWNVVLDSDDVSAIYNSGKPVNLKKADSYKTDRTSNLKGWWRMGDSVNDDIFGVSNTHGVVDDASNPGLSTTNLLASYPVDDPDGDGNWALASVWEYSTDNDGVFVFDDTGGGAINTGSDISIAAGKAHKLTFKIYTASGTGATSPIARMHIAEATTTPWTGTGYQNYAGSASGTLHTVYFLNPGSEDTTLKFTATNGGSPAGTTFGIGDIKLYAFNGKPGIATNMASDDLVKVAP